jgi:hypothetical protein
MINFKLDPKTGTPFYRQIIDQITFGIAAGNLENRRTITHCAFVGCGFEGKPEHSSQGIYKSWKFSAF